MIFEKRSYYALAGKMPLIHKRFAEHTLRLFERHGIKVVGFWEAYFGRSNVLHYMVQFADMAAREKAWASFMQDEEWQRARAESEKDGPLLDHIEVEIWKGTYYSPMK